MFTASFLRSAFNCPGNLLKKKFVTNLVKWSWGYYLRHVVTPDMVKDTKWFKSL